MEFKTEQLTQMNFWTGCWKEFLGSLLWITVAAQAGGTPWAWGIAYVIVLHAFENKNHFTPAVTFYRAALGKQDPIQAFFWLLAQALGAFVAVHFATALGMTADSAAGFAINDWKNGVQEFLGVAFFVWIHLQNADNEGGDMPKSVVTIISIVVAFQLAGSDSVFAANRQFAAFNTNFYVAYLWGAVGAIAAAFKYQWYTAENGEESNDNNDDQKLAESA